MKKLYLSIVLICLAALIKAQNNPVDEMFEKYSEMSGFTVVSISSKMFSMFADNEGTNKETDDIIGKLKSIKILSVEDSLLNKNLNFYTELSKKLDLSVYEELMVVKEGKDVTKFLVRQTGKIINELLVITGGPGGNSLISIKGDLNLKNLSEISKSVGMEELKDLDQIEEKKSGNR
jgi:hypothetical protein